MGSGFRVPDVDLSAVLQPLVFDSFTDANGVSLDAHVKEVGGAWTERTGTFDIQTNRADIAASTGVRDVATVPATVADLFARTTIRKTVAVDSGEFGHCLRYSDDDNFWMAQGDLTNNQIEIIERNAGVETQRAATARVLTDSTDYVLEMIADGQTITVFQSPGFFAGRAVYAAAALNVNATIHGVVGNQVGQTFDNYHQNARTSAVYDAEFGAV